MKRFISFALMLLVPVFVRAGVVDTMWLRTYFGSDSASPSWNQAADIEADFQGNVYVCGAGEKAVPGNNDMLIAKYNQWGETLWVRSYGGAVSGADDDIAQALAVDSVGNVFVVGATEYATPTDLDITWLKYDPNGNLLWARHSMLPDDDIGYDIVIGKDGDVYLCGTTTDTHFFLSTFFVARINPATGDTIWTRRYILDTLAFNVRRDRHPDFVMIDWDNWDNCATALAISPDSGHIVATGFGYSNARSYQIWTMKFLPNGTRRWAHEYWRSLDYDDVGFDVAVANNGYIFVAGFDENDNNSYDALLLRYAPTGGTPLTRRINDPMDDEDYFFAVTLDDSNPQNVYATGAYYQSTTSRFDIITYKANIGLTARWGNAGAIFATNQDDYGFDIAYNQGRVYVAGQRGNDLVLLAYSSSNTIPHDTIWSFTYNSPYNQEDFGAAVCALDSDNVYIAGQVARTGMSGAPCDLVTARLFYPFPDMAVTRIAAPAETVGYHDTITPQVWFVNTGNTLARFTARLRIGSGYDNTVNRNTPLNPGDSCLLDFAPWVAEPLGMVAIACTVSLAGDREPLNNILSGSVLVAQRDAGCLRIVAPVDTVDSGAVVQPQAWVRNFGTVSSSFSVRMKIGDWYQEVVSATVAPGDSALIQFPNWRAQRVGTWSVRCSTILAHDNNPANDYRDGTVVVKRGQISWPAGWQEVASLPLTPTPRPVREGAWLVVDEDNGLVYAAKGYKTGDFYCYNPLTNSWTALNPWLEGREGKLAYKGSAACFGEGYVYAVKGNNTSGFWRYSTGTGEWEQLLDVPLGASGKKVKGGGDMVYVSEGGIGYVYLLKGYKQDFMRYNTVSLAWEDMPDAPAGVNPKWDRGSWLVYDGIQTIYAHKAKYHELWQFELNTHQWGARLPGMPFQSGKTGKSKKSKDGGAACWYDGIIYALKGNNTCEFWMYDPVAQNWTELDPMPEVGSTGRRKRVKGGGDIVPVLGALWAFKGNKTVEFWRYGFGSDGTGCRVPSGVLTEGLSTGKGLSLSVVPGAICYTLSRSGLVRLTIYDQGGRRRWVLTPQYQPAGEHRVDIGKTGLAAGVYFVRLEVVGSGPVENVTGKLLLME